MLLQITLKRLEWPLYSFLKNYVDQCLVPTLKIMCRTGKIYSNIFDLTQYVEIPF